MDPVDIFNISLIEKKTPDDTSLCSYSNRLTGEEGLIMTKITCLRRLSGLLYPDKAAAADKPSHFIYSPPLTPKQQEKYTVGSRLNYRKYAGVRGLYNILTTNKTIRPHPQRTDLLTIVKLELEEKKQILNNISHLKRYLEEYEHMPIEKRSRVTKKKYQSLLDENHALKKRIIELEGKILKIIEY